jgi:hypothetical protein
MSEPFSIEDRQPIWIALSEFYLDTELQDSDFRHIALTILESPYTLDEVKKINKYEVFPILQVNLLSTAGEWAGFDKEWLLNKIMTRLKSKTKFSDIGVEVSYQMFKWMSKRYWSKLEKMYNDIKVNPDTFILTCRAAYFNNVLPFQFEKLENPTYKKLDEIAINYRDTNRLQDFYQHLQEGQYYINIWTAYFLIEKFSLDKKAKLIGLNDNETIFDFCYNLIERNFQGFPDKEQINIAISPYPADGILSALLLNFIISNSIGLQFRAGHY